MEVFVGTSPINGPFSIAMFDINMLYLGVKHGISRYVSQRHCFILHTVSTDDRETTLLNSCFASLGAGSAAKHCHQGMTFQAPYRFQYLSIPCVYDYDYYKIPQIEQMNGLKLHWEVTVR